MAADQPPALIAGLGNPGPRYAGNRHNIGFRIADELADRMGARFKAHRSGAEIVEGRLAGRRAILAKPRSLMNLSGGPVSSAAKFYKTAASDVVVLHDELDLPYGALRVKRGGGDNGHNGLRSISKSLDTRDYLRVRFGVGRPPGRTDPAEYVLKDFTAAERRELGSFIDQCADVVEYLVAHGLTVTQNRFH